MLVVWRLSVGFALPEPWYASIRATGNAWGCRGLAEGGPLRQQIEPGQQ